MEVRLAESAEVLGSIGDRVRAMVNEPGNMLKMMIGAMLARFSSRKENRVFRRIFTRGGISQGGDREGTKFPKTA